MPQPIVPGGVFKPWLVFFKDVDISPRRRLLWHVAHIESKRRQVSGQRFLGYKGIFVIWSYPW